MSEAPCGLLLCLPLNPMRIRDEGCPVAPDQGLRDTLFLVPCRHLCGRRVVRDLAAGVPAHGDALERAARLLEIETNTRQRLGEAQRMQWLGEVAGLQESLRRIADKNQQAERLRAQAGHGEAGVGALG